MQILPISFKNNLIGLCVAVLGLHCCTGAALVEGHGLLTAWRLWPWSAGSRACGFQQQQHRGSAAAPPGSGARAQWVGPLGFAARGMWGLPSSGVECVRPARAGGAFTTEPPGNPNAARVLLDLSQVLLFGM